MLVDFGSFHSRVDNVINDSFNYAVTRHRWNCQELKYRIFRSTLALSSALIHVLAHFQWTTCSQIYFRFSSYLLRKPHLFVILTAIGWFIVNIQSDLFWHRCLERQAFCTPRMYTLSPSKNIKGSNYGEFLKDKNVLLCTRLYKYAPNLESLLTQQYVCVMCTLWSDNTCVFSRFHSVKNANTQLIWSSVDHNNCESFQNIEINPILESHKYSYFYYLQNFTVWIKKKYLKFNFDDRFNYI